MSHHRQAAPPPPQQESPDPEEVLETLADDDARELFFRTETPKAVAELVAESGISRSTAYRKVQQLEDQGLIDLVPSEDSSASSPAKFRRVVEAVDIRIHDGVAVAYRPEAPEREDGGYPW